MSRPGPACYPRRQAPRRNRSRRAGIVVFWLIVATPALLVLFLVVLCLGSMWQARAELQNAVEAAALAGAKVWGDGDDTSDTRTSAHQAAQALFQANTVFANVVSISANNDPSATNNNQSSPGAILLGQYSSSTFAASQSPAQSNQRACRVSTTASIVPIMQGFGIAGPLTVQASATAVYSGSSAGSGQAQLVRPTSVSY